MTDVAKKVIFILIYYVHIFTAILTRVTDDLQCGGPLNFDLNTGYYRENNGNGLLIVYLFCVIFFVYIFLTIFCINSNLTFIRIICLNDKPCGRGRGFHL